MISGAAALAELIRTAGEVDEPGVHRMLPVVPELSGLLPGRGLRRGSTVAVATGRAAPVGGGTSLLLALLAEASRAGSWCAVVGVPSLGAVAAAESGIALDRLALVPDPGPEWPTVVAALIDGVDMVVAAVPGQIAGSVTSRLVARARQRGSVLVPFGSWDGADVTLQVIEGRWEGLGAGRGRLRRREVTVLARGRGAATRPKEITMWMPGVTVRPFTLPPPPATSDDDQDRHRISHDSPLSTPAPQPATPKSADSALPHQAITSVAATHADLGDLRADGTPQSPRSQVGGAGEQAALFNRADLDDGRANSTRKSPRSRAGEDDGRVIPLRGNGSARTATGAPGRDGAAADFVAGSAGVSSAVR